ncbi:hypothetical protein BGX27_002213 [Mortierella sp. AM989]|nr:hypothetical protein BGX27_002213 [Mortierella sp. AM989]
MGRPIDRNLEDEMMTKIKKLFDKILESVNKDNPTYTFDFEQFVDSFDENDQFTKRVFEFLVKEIAQRYRSTHPNSQHPNSQHPARPRPHTIHHHLSQEGGDNHNNINSSNGNSSNSSINATQSSHRHHHPHPQRASHLSQTLSSLERHSIARSLSIQAASSAPSDGSTANSSSGNALRYLFSNQGFGQGGTRRARIARRMLSNDLFAYHQGQPSLLSTISTLSNSSGSGQNRNLQESEAATNTDSINITEAEPTSSGSLPTTAVAAATTRRLSRRGETLERQRAFIYRPPNRASDPTVSMEIAPESFRTEGWNPPRSGTPFASETTDAASGEPHVGRPQSPERWLIEQARHLQEQLRQAQEARQQRVRQLYIQTLQARGRQRDQQQQDPQQSIHQRQTERTHNQHLQALLALQGQRSISSEDTLEQQQPYYQLRDNGLMLVQPYPNSPSSPTSITNSTIDNTGSGNPFQGALSTSILESQLPSEDSYHEFQDSTRRSRAAMRNALAAELNIEEDHQVLLTGEVSRRRRRRVVGRFSNVGSPDIASDNSNAIISQSQQHQSLEQIPRQNESRALVLQSIEVSSAENVAESSDSHQDLQCERQQTTMNNSGSRSSSSSILSSSESSTTIVETPVPTITVELTEYDPIITDNTTLTTNSENRENNDRLVSELNPESSNSSQVDGHQHHNVPPTPPSPNPNRNPMPTFQDRRRSSINPADIEAVVREMRANARSTVEQLGTISSPPSINSEERLSSQTPDQVTEVLEDTANALQQEPSELLPPGQTERGGVQPLPSPPQTESGVDSISRVQGSLLGTPPLH